MSRYIPGNAPTAACSLYKNNGGTPVTFTETLSSTGLSGVGYSCGSAWGDCDGDGDQDLFVTHKFTSQINKLYQNNGGTSFSDIASSANVAVSNKETQGAAWADYDNVR